MHHCLIRLRFKTPLHLGGDGARLSLLGNEMQLHSDTIFSALCIQALQSGGQQALSDLHEDAHDGRLLLSDALPYSGADYFLPKPVLSVPSVREVRTQVPVDRKEFRRLTYLPTTLFETYLQSLLGKTAFDPRDAARTFGLKTDRTMVSMRAVRPEQTPDAQGPLPYAVGLFSFMPDCGLYVVLGFAEKQQKERLLPLFELLGYSGLGGKRSDGFGRFAVEQVLDLEGELPPSAAKLEALLHAENAAYAMTIGMALPKEQELDRAVEGGYFTLVRRGGFAHASAHKKAVLYAMAAGSCFKQRFTGDVYDVAGKEIGHPVYRYLKPLFVGLEL